MILTKFFPFPTMSRNFPLQLCLCSYTLQCFFSTGSRAASHPKIHKSSPLFTSPVVRRPMILGRISLRSADKSLSSLRLLRRSFPTKRCVRLWTISTAELGDSTSRSSSPRTDRQLELASDSIWRLLIILGGLFRINKSIYLNYFTPPNSINFPGSIMYKDQINLSVSTVSSSLQDPTWPVQADFLWNPDAQ